MRGSPSSRVLLAVPLLVSLSGAAWYTLARLHSSPSAAMTLKRVDFEVFGKVQGKVATSIDIKRIRITQLCLFSSGVFFRKVSGRFLSSSC